MVLPKLLIRSFRPYIILLIIGLIYAAYNQYIQSKTNAEQQSTANLKTASQLINSQIEAATSKLYLLDEARSLDEFATTAQRILQHSPDYADIITFDKKNQKYRSVKKESTHAEQNPGIVWSRLNATSQMSISSIYDKQPNQWVFAIKYRQNNTNEIWIEFNLVQTTQILRELKTLSDGHLFIVDKPTGRLVFHANPQRIGTPSASYHSGIRKMVNSGQRVGQYEYYHDQRYKISVFDADNPYQWVFVAGTNRIDILAHSYQFSLIIIVLISLLLIALSFNYLTHQLNRSLAELSYKDSLPDFKYHLRAILDRFCHNKGIQLCFYDADYGYFSTIDYYGNSNIILKDKKFAEHFIPRRLSYTTKRSADPLAQKLQINTRHYTIPLFDKGNLVAVIYMQAPLPTCRSVLRIIRDYAEVTLSNLLLNQKIHDKDVMTDLDNKLTIRDKIDANLNKSGIYLATIDIDHFKRINNTYGHQCGDYLILHTAELMKKCFPKPGAISLARYAGEELCVLFNANDENDAYEQCELFRQMIDQANLIYEEIEVRYTVSIGITSVKDSQHTTIGRADKALYQAKGFGRNQVVLNTF